MTDVRELLEQYTTPERYIWKNTLTGHWMLSSMPKPANGRAGVGALKLGFRSWRAAWDEAQDQVEPARARAIASALTPKEEQ